MPSIGVLGVSEGGDGGAFPHEQGMMVLRRNRGAACGTGEVDAKQTRVTGVLVQLHHLGHFSSESFPCPLLLSPLFPITGVSSRSEPGPFLPRSQRLPPGSPKLMRR